MSEIRMIKIGDAWVRPDAIEAVQTTPAGRTGIYLANGSRLDVGDTHGSISPDRVVHALATAVLGDDFLADHGAVS